MSPFTEISFYFNPLMPRRTKVSPFIEILFYFNPLIHRRTQVSPFARRDSSLARKQQKTSGCWAHGWLEGGPETEEQKSGSSLEQVKVAAQMNQTQ